MVPYPKPDETQEKHGTLIHDAMNPGVFPLTTPKYRRMGAVPEVLCSECSR